ncbi:MAG: VWA domain-containing protein [Acidobacteria bacterium]|jgi:VWFA-related protein|nr:VWA domain-containing protein [Acidobacteriota bacterium]
MQTALSHHFSKLLVLLIVGLFVFNSIAIAQSRPQKGETPKSGGKKNQRPVPKTEAELKAEEERRKLEEEEKNAVVDDEVLKIKTNIVNVDAVVYNKKSGQIITGLKKENFAVFENGVKQDITNFATPEAPITVSLVVEFSKWSEIFGLYGSRGQESGTLEVIRPVAYFLTKFIKPPNDYASVIAFDIRPTPITDFTNDPARLRQTVDLLLRNNPAFRESNLFDALKFSLVGGKGDSVVLENSKERTSQYSGMIDVKAPRRAIILVASGIDTFSRINYGEIRKVIQNSGVPIYIISTGKLFLKMYDHQLPATDGIDGTPGRMTFLQADNAMNTFAKESGGAHFSVTFPGEIPTVIQSINNLMRSQYSIAYDANEKREPGKKYILDVKVDIDGDGVYEEKGYVIQHRPFYTTPKADIKEK